MSRYIRSTKNAQKRADAALTIFRDAASELERVAADQQEVAERAFAHAAEVKAQARDAEKLSRVVATQAAKVRSLFGG